MRIAIGGDHAGFEYKAALVDALKDWGHVVSDFGAYAVEAVDYPDHVHPVCESISRAEHVAGVLICGSGNGVAMTANKHACIRAALCWTEKLAELARQHNDANVLCVPARFVTLAEAVRMMQKFMTTGFEGGRHAKRVRKISC